MVLIQLAYIHNYSKDIVQFLGVLYKIYNITRFITLLSSNIIKNSNL